VEKLDIITAVMGHALASEGGICTGSAEVVSHQVCVTFWESNIFFRLLIGIYFTKSTKIRNPHQKCAALQYVLFS